MQIKKLGKTESVEVALQQGRMQTKPQRGKQMREVSSDPGGRGEGGEEKVSVKDDVVIVNEREVLEF